MSRWYCPQCGHENEGNFCVACGTAQPAGMPAIGPAQASAPATGVAPEQMPSFTVTFETGKHYKVHSSYIWLGPLVATLAVVLIGALNNIPGIIQVMLALQQGAHGLNGALIALVVIVGIAVIYGVVLGIYALGYKNMSYVFDEREFSFYSGIITKRRVHLPYARVQSVNHRATVIQRLAGVCTVSIDSAGGASNKALRVPYLRLETAERMRVDLFVRKAAVEVGAERAVAYDPNADSASIAGAQTEAERVRRERGAAPVAPGVAGTPVAFGQVPGSVAPNALDTVGGVVGEWRGVYGGAVAGLEPVSYELGLSNRELLFTSLSHGTPILVAAIVGLSFFITIASIAFVGDAFSRAVVSLGVPILLGSMLVTWLIGVLGTAIQYGNYRARRRGSRIEVEHGLLQRNFSGIDIARVQSIEVRQSFVRRLIGYCEISLGRINAGGDDAGNKNSSAATRGLVIHPFVKVDRVDEVLDGLLPELGDRPRVEDLHGLPAPALRRSVLRRCVWYNVSLYIAITSCVFVALVNMTPGGLLASTARGLFGMLILVVVLCVAYTVFQAVGAVFWARKSGYTWNRGYLMLHNDGLSVARSIVPRQKIQSGRTRSNPFQRRLSLTGISAVTAAGTRSTSATLIDIPAEAGAAYLDWLKPRH